MWQAFETGFCITTVTLSALHSIREVSLTYNFTNWLSTWYFLGKVAQILEVVLKILKTSNRQHKVLQVQLFLHGERLYITWPLPAFPALTPPLLFLFHHLSCSQAALLRCLEGTWCFKLLCCLVVLFCPFNQEHLRPFGYKLCHCYYEDFTLSCSVSAAVTKSHRVGGINNR